MSKKVIIIVSGVIVVLVIGIAVFLSVYYGMAFKIDKYITEVFDNGEEATFFNGSTGEEYILDAEKTMNIILANIENYKFRNVPRSNRLGFTVSLSCNKKSMTIGYNTITLANGKRVKTDVENLDGKIMEEILDKALISRVENSPIVK